MQGNRFSFWRYPTVVWCIAIIFGLSSATAMWTSVDSSLQLAYMVVCASLILGAVAGTFAFRYCFNVLNDWSTTLRNFIVCTERDPVAWFVGELGFLDASPGMYMFATVFAAAATIVGYLGVLKHYASGWPLGLATCISLLSEFVAGAGLYAAFGLARLLRKLGTLPGCAIRVAPHQFGVLSTGDVLLKCFGAVLGAWSFYQLSIVPDLMRLGLTPLHLLSSPIVLAVTIPTIAFVLAMLVFCQLPLHVQMVSGKREQVLRLEAILNELSLTTANISDDLMKKRKFVTDELRQAQLLPEWPLTKPAAVLTGLSSLLPLIASAGVSQAFQSIVRVIATS